MYCIILYYSVLSNSTNGQFPNLHYTFAELTFWRIILDDVGKIRGNCSKSFVIFLWNENTFGSRMDKLS